MPTLYSYCIPYDDGAAPNPFWGVCTLAICKPVIRRTARVGDWIVGTGSKQFGFENRMVYAMRVTDKMSMEDYDRHCRKTLRQKIPNKQSTDFKKRRGDCIYDFSVSPALIRLGVHDEGNRIRDLGGKFVLLSDHFYYFGSQPVLLPDDLLPIVRQGQGHKSTLNKPYVELFLSWILNSSFVLNTVIAGPMSMESFEKDCDYMSKCAVLDRENDDRDEELAGEC